MKIFFRYLIILFYWCVLTPHSVSQEFLPVYSSPAVLLDSTGKVVHEIDENYFLEFVPLNNSSTFYNTVGKGGTIIVRHRPTNRIHLITPSGNWINGLRPLSGLSKLTEGFYVGKSYDDKYFFYDQGGSLMFSRTGYDKAQPFSEGLAAVKNEGRYFYLNDLGHEIDLVPKELKGIYEVFSFHEGLSRIRLKSVASCPGSGNRYVFIDRTGKIVLDTDQLLPGKIIDEMTDFKEGISLIRYYENCNYELRSRASYIDLSGKELIKIVNSAYTHPYSIVGMPVTILNQKTTHGNIDSAYILTNTGKRKFFKPYQGQPVQNIYHLADDFFAVVYQDSSDAAKKITRIYSSGLDKVRYVTKHDIRAVKWDLLSLYDPKEGRTYVVNMSTGEVVFDRDVSTRVFTDLASTVLYKNKVQRFLCDDPAEINKLNQFKNLRELSFERMNITKWDYHHTLPKLEVLRFDSLMLLDSFPTYFKGLKKIAVRNCFRAQNVIQLIDKQDSLKILYVINMGVPQEEVKRIYSKLPDAYIKIDGYKSSSTMITRDESWDWLNLDSLKSQN